MTQQCKHDEQLLDFVYGELSDAERKAFAEHLPGCSACTAQVEGFGQVRKEFQQRPPIEPVGESMQRMTALLMQAAAATAPASGTAAVAGGGGKVLAFRSRGLRRILVHPAGGIMAVAAAALFYVVFRSQPGPQTGALAPSPETTIGSPSGAAGSAPVGVGTTAAPAKVAQLVEPGDKTAQAVVADPAPAQRGLVADNQGSTVGAGRGDSDFDGLRGKSQAGKDVATLGSPPTLAEKKAEAPALSQLVATAEKPMAPAATTKSLVPMDSGGGFAASAAGGKGSTRLRAGDAQYRQSNSGPAVVAMADQAYAKSAKKEAGFEAERPQDRWSQPPAAAPPPPPPQAAAAAPQAAPRPSADDDESSVSRAIARTQEERKQKVVAQLADQELGGLSNGAPAPAAPSNEGRYAQHAPATGSSNKADTAASNLGNRAMEPDEVQAATPAMPANSMQQGRAVNTLNLTDDAAAALSTAKEQIRRNQCTEANATLAKLERVHPTTRGLAETRADWQSACAAPAQQLLDRRMHNEALEQSAPAAQAAPYRASKMKMASPAPMPPKKAAPAKAASKPERGGSKASDLAL